MKSFRYDRDTAVVTTTAGRIRGFVQDGMTIEVKENGVVEVM